MSTLESIFIKEFNRNMRASGAIKNIYEVPLPEEVGKWNVSGEELYYINGLSKEGSGLYYGLNGSLVKKLPKNVVASRRKVDLVTRDFVRDSNNRFVYEDVKIPTDSVVVISDKNLELPYKYSCKEENFGYIDFVTDGTNKEFIYYIPKKYVYLTHQSALALSVKNMKNFAGMGYKSWKYGLIYLHVIPYKPHSQYVGTKILATGVSLDYNEKIRKIVDYWVSNNIIPNIGYSDTESEGNLVLKETIRGYEDYNPIEELSLGDREIYGEQSINEYE